jgi:HlyD family secretion protein
MQVVANLDESDVGRIRPGQPVTFRVDAYPSDTFSGKVSQVRLEPKVNQNVVTYATVIDVPNNELKLKPGMTANVNIEIARRTNVLRVPNAALRFRPTAEIYTALGQTPPAPGQGRADTAMAAGSASEPEKAGANGENGHGNEPGSAAAGAARAGVERDTTAAPQSGTGDRPREQSRERMGARLQNLSPEEREQILQRMRTGGAAPSSAREGARAEGRGRGNAPAAATSPSVARPGGATTIDALFGPLPEVQTAGRAWLHADNQLKPVRLRLGVSDGQNTELIDGDLQQGTAVVTNVNTGTETTRPALQSFPPFAQPTGRGGFGGGGFGGGGFGGNRGGGGGR